MKILALDLGKFNTMHCFFDTKTRKHQFLNATTDRNYLTTVFKKHKTDLIVMEACGPSGWINDLAQSLGHKALVCSTNEDAWKWSNVKRKIDKDDALKLARMAAMKELKAVHMPLARRILASIGCEHICGKQKTRKKKAAIALARNGAVTMKRTAPGHNKQCGCDEVSHLRIGFVHHFSRRSLAVTGHAPVRRPSQKRRIACSGSRSCSVNFVNRVTSYPFVQGGEFHLWWFRSAAHPANRGQ